jgi:UbiD family decarboxylase
MTGCYFHDLRQISKPFATNDYENIMKDFYIGGASVKLFLPIFKMNFPEILDIALPAEGVFHNLVFVSIRKTYPMQAYKIMHGLWGMGADDVYQIDRGNGR